MVSKILSCTVVSLIGLFALLFIVGFIGTLPHKFVGNEVFSSLEDMQRFQNALILEAELAGASIESFDLSILSPPKVNYIVYNPNGLEFKYGVPVIPYWGAIILQIVMGTGLLLGLVLLNIVITRDENFN